MNEQKTMQIPYVKITIFVNNYPTAELIILGTERISKEEYTIKAEITIKEITQKIAFNAKIDRKMARANLVIDRTLFGIIYKSGNFFKTSIS